MFHVGVIKSQDCCGERATERSADQNGRPSLTSQIVDEIADFKGIDPVEPGFSLYESVDTDALEDLFASASGIELRTEFRAAEVLVCVCKTTDDETVVKVSDSHE